MYGNYRTTGDQPECSTYPKSGGRTGGSLFNKKWGQRLSSKCKPIPMTWDDDDDDDNNSGANSPQPVNNWEEMRNNLVQNIENNEENENEKCNQQSSWQDDSMDAAYEISCDQQNSIISHAGSLYDQRHEYVDSTYPAARSVNGGICHPFSTYAVQQQKGEIYEATPFKDNVHNFPKTEGKQYRGNWLDGLLAKTPHFERRSAENNSVIFGDSGISSSTKHTSTRNFVEEDENPLISKNPSRSLFTPSVSRKMPHTAHELLDSTLNNKLLAVEEIELKKSVKDAIPSVIYNKLAVRQQLQNDETPMKGLPEKVDYIQLVKSHKSEKKTTGNKAHLAGFFTEENKENISYVQTMADSPSGIDREQKLQRSKSHSSVLRDDGECFITPSKEERSLSHANAKSLTNLSHPNPPISQNIHNSRIPTPIRTRTPLKQHSQESVCAGGTQMKTSEADIPTKFSYSPHKKDATLGNQPPPNHMPLFSTCHKESSLQFGGAPVIHSMLPSTQGKTSQADILPLHIPAVNSQSNGWSSKNPDTGSFHGLLGHSGGISNTNKKYLSQYISNFQHSNHSGHQNMMPFVGVKDSNSAKNPSNSHDTAVSGAKDDQDKVSNGEESNSLLAPVSFSQPAIASHVSNTSSKPFMMRPPVFQVTSQKSDLVHDSRSIHTTSISSFQKDSGSNQLTCSQNIELSHKTSHVHISGSLSQPLNSLMKTAPLFQTTSTCNKNSLCTGSVNQEVERNQCFKPVAQPQVSHQPSENLFATSKTQYDSMNHHHQGNASYKQVNGNDHPVSNPAINSHSINNPAISNQANIQTINPPNSNQPNQNFAVPAAKVNTQPQVSAMARPTSSNRQLLTVNSRRYEVLRLLGKGASSKVYDALDCQTNRCVAVKRVVLRQGDALVDGYLKEVELLNQLQGSDCIIKLLDSQVCIERGYKVLNMVMERGEMDLSTSIKLMSAAKCKSTPESEIPGSKIPIVTVIFYWVSMLNAVDEIHRKGIFHSDLKPANFLLVGGQLKLIDFGIATAVQTDVTSVIKEDPAGTPNYMSPEAIGLTVCGSPNTEDTFQNPKASYKSDVWSLGCILYSLIYGRSPFQHITNERFKLDAIRNTNYAIPFPPHYSVHPPLLKALKRCLVREYKQRASIAELKSIDYLCSDYFDEHTWEAWRDEKIKIAEKRLSACSPESQRIAMKVIQEVLQSPPKKKEAL